MTALKSKPIEDIVSSYEGHSCMDATAYRQLTPDATLTQKIAAIRETIDWYERHSDWIIQGARNDLLGLERSVGLDE